jgi:DNA recombination protein RmuC
VPRSACSSGACSPAATSRCCSRRSRGWQRQAVEHLVRPLREQLHLVEAQLRALEVERVRAQAELRQQVGDVRRTSELLGRETAALVDALRRPQARGRWGEVQLRRCVEYAGMLDRCDFSEQETLRDADGSALRPDLVVRLAGGRTVVVDAKVTLAAYLEAAECPDESAAAERMAAHARHLRSHVDRLADKSYWAALPDSPEFVVLFVPGEAFLAPALEHDPALLEHAYARRVHVATPTTLVSLLRTVAHGWQQHALTENARAVVASGQELYARLGTLGGHVDKLGRSLGTAVADFNKTVGSFERTVLPAARRMTELGLAGDVPAPPRTVDELPRGVSAPELVPALAPVPEPSACAEQEAV